VSQLLIEAQQEHASCVRVCENLRHNIEVLTKAQALCEQQHTHTQRIEELEEEVRVLQEAHKQSHTQTQALEAELLNLINERNAIDR